VREPRKMPAVLSPEEVARLLEAAPGPKYKAALSAAYAAGLRVLQTFSKELLIVPLLSLKLHSACGFSAWHRQLLSKRASLVRRRRHATQIVKREYLASAATGC
jgi:hypothetical protein